MTPPRGEFAEAARRIGLVARQTVVEAVRMRLGWVATAAAAGLVLLATGLRELNFGAPEMKFLRECGTGAIGLLGWLLALLMSPQLFFREIDGAGIGFLLTRKLRRTEFLAGKMLGVGAVLALFTLALCTLLAGILARRAGHLPGEGSGAVALAAASLVLWLKMTLVSGMALLVCSYADNVLFALSAGLLLAVAGHLRPFAAEGTTLLVRAIPDLTVFDASRVLDPAQPPAMGFVAGIIAYWAAWMLACGLLASCAFSRREF